MSQFARAVAEHAFALGGRRIALETGSQDLAAWEARVAETATRRAQTRHLLMLQVISADPGGTRRFVRA